MVGRNQNKLGVTGAIALLGVFTVAVVPAQEMLEVLTYLEPYRSIEISAIETGVIGEIFVEEGALVSKGDVLLKLDTEITEARLAIATTQASGVGRIQVAQAEVDIQRQRFDMLEPLVLRGSSNRAELDRQEATLKQAEGNLVIAQEEQETFRLQVRQIEAELRRRTLISPIDGIVVEVTKDVAEPVTASQVQDDAFLVRVVELDRLRCDGFIPALEALQLEVGSVLPVRIEDGSDYEVEGEIEFVSPIIDPATATVRIRLVIDNPERKLRSGATAQILVPRAGSPGS